MPNHDQPPRPKAPPWMIKSLADFYDVGVQAIHMAIWEDQGYSVLHDTPRPPKTLTTDTQVNP